MAKNISKVKMELEAAFCGAMVMFVRKKYLF